MKTNNQLDISRIHSVATKLLTLTNVLVENQEKLSVAISHGDFTPWNMYATRENLHLFDWELSKNEMPLLFDLFHFVFQSEIMIRRSNYQKIKKALQKIIRLESCQNIINNHSVNLDDAYAFYLVYNITYYLDKYIIQKELHEQVFWLFNVWEHAVEDLIENNGSILNG